MDGPDGIPAQVPVSREGVTGGPMTLGGLTVAHPEFFTHSPPELPPVAEPSASWGRYLPPGSQPGCGHRKRDLAAWLQSLITPLGTSWRSGFRSHPYREAPLFLCVRWGQGSCGHVTAMYAMGTERAWERIPPLAAVGYSQGSQGAQLAEGVSSNFPDAVVLKATGAARRD